MIIISILGSILLGIGTFVIAKPADVFCKWMERHEYETATINSDGHWETICKRKGCGSTLVYKDSTWKEKV